MVDPKDRVPPEVATGAHCPDAGGSPARRLRGVRGPVGLSVLARLTIGFTVAEILLCLVWFVTCLIASRVVGERLFPFPVIWVGIGCIVAGVASFFVGVAVPPRARPGGLWWISLGSIAVLIGGTGIVFAACLVLATI